MRTAFMIVCLYDELSWATLRSLDYRLGIGMLLNIGRVVLTSRLRYDGACLGGEPSNEQRECCRR